MNDKKEIIRVRRGAKIISIILIIYIFSSLVGYSMFNEQLVISGSVDTAEYYKDPALPVELVIRDTQNNRYMTESDHKPFLDLEKENWAVNTFTAVYNKKPGLVIGTKTITYTISFTNPTVLDFTDGKISTSIIQNPGNVIKSINGSISKTVVKPGEQCDVSITLKHNFLTPFETHKVKGVITYVLQEQVRTLNFFVQFGGERDTRNE